MQHNDLMNDPDNMSRLAWACRRGMLELDVLLGNFLKEAYSGLNYQNKIAFTHLLGCQDPDLFDWLMGHTVSDDPELAAIVDKIRQHAKSRF